MLPSRQQLISVAWQSAGSVATVTAAAWVSWRLGLAAQGQFALARSWFDAVTAIVSFGLPQGILHLLYRRNVPAFALRRFVSIILACTSIGGVLSALLIILLGNALAPLEAKMPHLLVSALCAMPFGVAHLILRSLLLHDRGPALFGIATALPALLSLAGVLLLGALGIDDRFPEMLLASSVLTAAITAKLLGVAQETQKFQGGLHVVELWRVSLQSWLQAACAALLPAALLLVCSHDGTGAALGLASLMLLVYQIFSVLAGYLGPLLFDKIARDNSVSVVGRRHFPLLKNTLLGLLVLIAAVGTVVAQAKTIPVWLMPVLLVLPAGLAALAARMLGTVLLARGSYRELSFQAIWRLFLCVLVASVALPMVSPATALTGSLLVIEIITLVRLCFLVIKRDRGGSK